MTHMAPTTAGNALHPDRESEFEQEHDEIILISARNLKSLLKGTGHRLSSHAFQTLNSFLIAILQCIARQLNQQLAREKPAIPTPSLSEPAEVPWSSVLRVAATLVPSVEGWFSTWFTLLQQHLQSMHGGKTSFDRLQCCKEMSEKCSLMLPDECERVLRLSMHPLLQPGWLVTSSIIYTLNDVVHWIVRVATRVVESKGLGTVRRAEISAVLQKAPIFERLHQHLNAQPPSSTTASLESIIKQEEQQTRLGDRTMSSVSMASIRETPSTANLAPVTEPTEPMPQSVLLCTPSIPYLTPEQSPEKPKKPTEQLPSICIADEEPSKASAGNEQRLERPPKTPIYARLIFSKDAEPSSNIRLKSSAPLPDSLDYTFEVEHSVETDDLLPAETIFDAEPAAVQDKECADLQQEQQNTALQDQSRDPLEEVRRDLQSLRLLLLEIVRSPSATNAAATCSSTSAQLGQPSMIESLID